MTPPLVLMYHSVIPYDHDPYLVTVSPLRLDRQFTWLRRQGLRGVSMRELLAARDRGLFHAVTDCGAGGFSSAVGEMGEKIGAEVNLDRAPLKYEGLSYTEIWISEAQERMVLAVPEKSWPELEQLCRSEGVEATVIGTFSIERTPSTWGMPGIMPSSWST